jgi:photosystem II stability/assembly factor-like uncharacterized protein
MASPTRVLRSTDGGGSWSFGPGSLITYPQALAVSPSDPNVVYAACGTMWKTTNGGTSWSQLPLANFYCRTVVVNPLNPQTVYVGGYTYGTANRVGIARSRNAGASWEVLLCDTASMNMGNSVGLDPIDTCVVYAGGLAVGGLRYMAYKSTDCGSTWVRLNATISGTPYAFHVSPLDHNLVAMATGGGIYRSTDGGATWTRVLAGSSVCAFASLAAEPQVIFAGAADGVYRSSDSGRTWVSASSGLLGTGMFGLAATGSALFRSTKDGVYRSTDNGANWHSVTTGVAFNRIAAIGLARTDETFYVECEDNAVYGTRDNGSTWTRSPEFLSCGNICGIAVSPASSDVVWALEGSG